MVKHEIDTILSTLRLEADSSFGTLFDEFENCYENKLWHQLTVNLKEFYFNELSKPIRLRVYDTFISKVLDKLNQLDVVEFLLLSLSDHSNFDESLNYLTQLKNTFTEFDEKKTRNDGLASHYNGNLLIDIEIARIYLLKKDIVKARDLLDSLEKILDSKDSIPLRILNSFYSTTSNYFKLKDDFNSFYYNSLLYLSTFDSEKQPLSAVQNFELAYNICIAALLGDKIYNFGELLNHPVIEAVRNNSQYQWLIDLLNSLTIGDFNQFDSIIKKKLLNEPILAEHESFLRQKICLMTLVESVFAKNIRSLTFEDIATATHLSKDNVEHLVMRSISLGLLKGSIDQVNEIVSITWVQPRIINFEQIVKMNNRLIQWNDEVKALSNKIDTHGRSIWV